MAQNAWPRWLFPSGCVHTVLNLTATLTVLTAAVRREASSLSASLCTSMYTTNDVHLSRLIVSHLCDGNCLVIINCHVTMVIFGVTASSTEICFSYSMTRSQVWHTHTHTHTHTHSVFSAFCLNSCTEKKNSVAHTGCHHTQVFIYRLNTDTHWNISAASTSYTCDCRSGLKQTRLPLLVPADLGGKDDAMRRSVST